MPLGMAHTQDPYPDVELAAPPLAQPLHEPKLVYSTEPNNDDDGNDSSNRSVSSMSDRRKRESYDLSGSTYLVTASGITLKLPIPSDSDLDPLNWGRWKAAGAMFAIAWYFVAASTAIQAPSVILPGVAREFGAQVDTPSPTLLNSADCIVLQDIRPWSIESIVTAPTLFIGIGALLWLPLSIALGRRPVFLVAALMMPLAAIGAAFSTNFHALFGCVCLLGLGQGFSITSVRIFL